MIVMFRMMTVLLKRIPLWVKVPVVVFAKEVGRMPFCLVWQHARCAYAEAKEMPHEKKMRFLQKKHQVTCRYLKKKYGRFIVERSAQYSMGEKNKNFPIWILWWQGEENAPELVKRCIQSIRKNANGHPVHVVHAGNYSEFISLEPHIIEKLNSKSISLTHFSDIIRMNLLARNGGFWMDSTIFCTKEIDGNVFDRPIFTLRNPGEDLENISRWEWTGFAIYGWQGGKLFCLMRDFFNRYWQDHKCLIDYFLIDYGIRLICDSCSDVMSQIDTIPANNQQLYFYQRHFNDAYTEDLSCVDTGDTWLYKLSWKGQYSMLTDLGEKTLYAAWCEETLWEKNA